MYANLRENVKRALLENVGKRLRVQDAFCRVQGYMLQRKGKDARVKPRKYKAGLAMSQHKLSVGKFQPIH